MTATNTDDPETAVLMVINDAFPSKYATGPAMTCELIASQLSLKFGVTIVTNGYDRLRGVSIDLGQLSPDQAARNINRKFLAPGLRGYFELASIIKESRGPLFLHCLFEYRLVLPAFVMGLVFGRRMLFHLPHGMLLDVVFEKHNYRKRMMCLLLDRTWLGKRIIHLASSEIEKRDILEKIGHNQKIIVIPQPVDVASSLRPSSFRGRVLGEPLSICSIGRVSKQKNLMFVLEVIRQIEFDVIWNVYGDIEDRAYYEACMNLVSQLPDHIQVRFHGQLAHNDLMAEVGRSDLLFMPTLGENHGHAILEAMAMGCPVLISDRCPWTDVNSCGAGWSYDLDDQSQFVAVLRLVNQSGADWAKVQRAASNYFDEKRRLSDNKYIELLESMKDTDAVNS